MKTIYTPKLIDVLPDSVLNDSKLRASAEALDFELEKLSADIRQVLHLPRLDELSGKILDYLAEQFHIDFYEPLYLSDGEKKNLIRESIAWHRIKGTVGAVEQIAKSAFRDAKITEWFNYEGGKPYHFKITTQGYKSTPDGFKTFLRMIDAAKNVRSWLDDITVDYSRLTEPVKVYAGIAETQIGTKTYLPSQPNDQDVKVGVGQIISNVGEKFISLPKPQICYGNKQILHAGQILIRGGELLVEADLRDLPDYSDIRESGIADLLIADFGIARLGEMVPLAQTYDPVYKQNFYVGCVNLIDGNKTLNLNKPQDQKIKLGVKTIELRQGSQTIGFDTNRRMPTQKIIMRAGQVLVKAGSVTILPDLSDRYFATTLESGIADLLIADVGIARPTGITDNEKPQDYIVPEGEFLRLYFDFPTGRDKPLLLKNPRKDLVVGDVKSVGNQARDDKIFLNSKSEGTLGIKRVDLINGFKITGAESFATLPAGDQLRLFFSFPSGNDHKILANNMRQGITVEELQAIGVQAATNQLLVNARGETTTGLTRAAVVKKVRIDDKNVNDSLVIKAN